MGEILVEYSCVHSIPLLANLQVLVLLDKSKAKLPPISSRWCVSQYGRFSYFIIPIDEGLKSKHIDTLQYKLARHKVDVGY